MKNILPKIAFVFLILAAFPGRAELIDSYPTYEEMVAEIYELSESDPDRVELIEYGKSVEGRPLLVLRIHRGDCKDRPDALVDGLDPAAREAIQVVAGNLAARVCVATNREAEGGAADDRVEAV